jgi:hypothetical protein
MNRRPIIYMRRMSSVASKFKMNRQMDRRYMHRFIRRPRVWLQYGSRLCASALDDPTPWPLVHPTVAFKSNRNAPRLLLQHRMNPRLDGRNHRFIRRLDSNQTEHPKCGAFSTRWSNEASVYSVGALSGFLGLMATLESVSDRMIRRFAGGDHRFIRRYYFFRQPFLIDSLPC